MAAFLEVAATMFDILAVEELAEPFNWCYHRKIILPSVTSYSGSRCHFWNFQSDRDIGIPSISMFD